MQIQYRPYAPAAMAALLALTACGKKESHDDPAPQEAVTTTVSTTRDGGNVNLEYSSNIKDAKFLCELAIDNQKVADWQACQPSLQLKPGSTTILRIKAVSPRGAEDPNPVVKTWAQNATQPTPTPAPGKDTSTSGPKNTQLSTMILNKSLVGSTYNKANLTLSFGISGGPEVDLSDLAYYCKREGETQFKRCPNNDRYDFGQLTDGQNYSLEVQAVVKSTNTVAATDKLDFSVNLACGQSQAAQNPGGLGVPANAANPAGSGLPQSSANPWSTAGQQPSMSALPPPSTCGAGQPVQQPFSTPVPQTYRIGSYDFVISPDMGMHMTEYATVSNQQGQFVFYNVTTDTDPFYLGAYPCETTGGNRFPALAPDGKTLFKYCFSSTPVDYFKEITGANIALNHLEMATDYNKVDRLNHDFISFNYFDRFTVDVMQKYTRFQRLCGGKQIIQSPPIQIAAGFFQIPVFGRIYMCNTPLTVASSQGLPTIPGATSRRTSAEALADSTYWIGSFFVTGYGAMAPSALSFPAINCYTPRDQLRTYDSNSGLIGAVTPDAYVDVSAAQCSQFTASNTLELTFISKFLWPSPMLFARYIQDTLFPRLSENVVQIH